MAQFCKNSPLADAATQLPDANHPSDTVCSYASVHANVSAKAKTYATKYKDFVVNYVLEWETTVTTRINNGIKKVEDQRRELNHYQKKVEALRLANNKIMAKGKQVKPDDAEKLKRNEEKFLAAKQTYNKICTALCILMEEVSERFWRDLHPVLVKVAQFDMTMATDESNLLADLSKVVDKLKQVSTANGISAQPRIKDLGSLNPELLSTRPGGVAGFQIEGDFPISSSPIASDSDMALPPGSVGAQGMGGFPVRVASAAGPPNTDVNQHMSRTSSFSSYGSAPPSHSFDNQSLGSGLDPSISFNALAISQSPAPAPTLDDVYGSFGRSARSAPSSGNLPPLPPKPSTFGDYDSLSSSFGKPYGSPPAAAPPMAPPPPPPVIAPPTVPPMVGYGGPVVATSPTGVSPYAYAAAPPPYGHNPNAYNQAPWGQAPPINYPPYPPPPQQQPQQPSQPYGSMSFGSSPYPPSQSTNPFDP